MASELSLDEIASVLRTFGPGEFFLHRHANGDLFWVDRPCRDENGETLAELYSLEILSTPRE